MQRLLILINLLLIVVISACSKRTVDLEAVKFKEKISSKLDSNFVSQVKKDLQEQKISIYDREHSYQVDITPDGDFHFDPANGFTGKAKNISIKGNLKGKAEITEQKSAKTDSLQSTAVKKQQESKQENTSKNKKTESKGFPWPTLLLLAAFSTILIIISKKILPWLQLYLSRKKLKK